MNNLGDYLDKKMQELDLERGDILFRIQVELDKKYPGKTRVKKIHNKVLYIQTTSSSVASELRFSKDHYLSDEIEKVVIRS